MSEFQTQTQVSLSPQWVEDLLVTAFDPQHGGCNYWIVEEEDLRAVDPVVVDGMWDAVTLWYYQRKEPLTQFNGGYCQVHLADPGDGSIARTVTIQRAQLNMAWAYIVDRAPCRADIVEQFRQSQMRGDLDVDAEAADVMMQIILFGEIVFG